MDHAPDRARRSPSAGRWWAPGDIVVALAVAALSAFLIAQGVADAGAGSLRAVVSVNGKEAESLPLGVDVEEMPVVGYRGMSYIQVRGGRVRMLDSACPDKLCVHSGWISRPGESLVCLPNRVVIEIRSGGEGPDVVNR